MRARPLCIRASITFTYCLLMRVSQRRTRVHATIRCAHASNGINTCNICVVYCVPNQPYIIHIIMRYGRRASTHCCVSVAFHAWKFFYELVRVSVFVCKSYMHHVGPKSRAVLVNGSAPRSKRASAHSKYETHSTDECNRRSIISTCNVQDSSIHNIPSMTVEAIWSGDRLGIHWF